MKDFIRFALRTAITGLFLTGFPQVLSTKVIAAQAPGPENVEESRDVLLPSGENQRILFVQPASPHGAIVMLPGGAGHVGIDVEGGLSHENNFVVRTRALWRDQGYVVIIPDAFNGQKMRGLRRSAAYAQVVTTLVNYAHEQTSGPVFLLGTSQGSIAAMNGAANLAAPALAGVVLTESVSRPGKKSRETVFDPSPEQVTVPALIVANRTSKCHVAPAKDAPLIKAAMTRAVKVEILYVQGGELRSSNPCSSMSPHGYLGIEPEVVTKIAAWLKAHQ